MPIYLDGTDGEGETSHAATVIHRPTQTEAGMVRSLLLTCPPIGNSRRIKWCTWLALRPAPAIRCCARFHPSVHRSSSSLTLRRTRPVVWAAALPQTPAQAAWCAAGRPTADRAGRPGERLAEVTLRINAPGQSGHTSLFRGTLPHSATTRACASASSATWPRNALPCAARRFASHSVSPTKTAAHVTTSPPDGGRG